LRVGREAWWRSTSNLAIALKREAAPIVDQIVRQALAGKRFALMGFEAVEAASIIAALATVRGLGHVVGDAPSIPGLNSLAAFDACFVNATATGGGDQPSPLEMVARSRKPAIIIGNLEELVTRFAAVAGLNRDFILRPCGPEEMLFRAYRIIGFVETAAAEAVPPSRNGGRLVVLADDDATTIVLISTILKHFNFACEVAHDGVQALEVARARKPDLVLLDVSMPKMNGFEALTAMRGDSATRNTPIVLVSGRHDEADVVKGFTLGADDYISKPFNSGELMARINRVLRL
jgi:CheY-like chemotaxis protein